MKVYLGVGVVGVPRRPQTLLATDVPHQEVCILHDDLFNVTADGRRRVDDLFHQAA